MGILYRPLALALLFAVTVVTATAQVTARAVKKGSVAGKVTIKGKAAAGVVVGLVETESAGRPFQPTYRAVSDLQGNYRVADVPPGSYLVNALAPAYVLTGDSPRGKTVVIGDGENVENIDFALVRGGVVTGKVTDVDGRPMIDQRVNLLRSDSTRTYMQAMVLTAQTDDRGIYRMFGVAAGNYKISTGQGQDPMTILSAVGRAMYKETFHPDVNDMAKATVIQVTEGSESSNVDIKLGRVAQTFTVIGRVIQAGSGEPVSDVRIGAGLRSEAGGSFISNQAALTTRGQFRLENLLPGKYTAFILPSPNNSMRANPVPFEIVDQDVNDVVITVSPAVTLSGVVVLENSEDPAVFARLTQLKVQGYVQNTSGVGVFGQTSSINRDGSFHLSGLGNGIANLSLGPYGDRETKNFHLLRAERDGVVQPRGIEIKDDTNVTGVRLVVIYGSGIIRGEVRLQNGTLSAGEHVAVRLSNLRDASENPRPPSVDARGHFLVEGLPPGDYEIIAYLMPRGGIVPPLDKQQVRISADTITDVLLTIDLTPKPRQ
jgi:hypothetical protein